MEIITIVFEKVELTPFKIDSVTVCLIVNILQVCATNNIHQSKLTRNTRRNKYGAEEARQFIESNSCWNECWFCHKETRRTAVGSAANYYATEGMFVVRIWLGSFYLKFISSDGLVTFCHCEAKCLVVVSSRELCRTNFKWCEIRNKSWDINENTTRWICVNYSVQQFLKENLSLF